MLGYSHRPSTRLHLGVARRASRQRCKLQAHYVDARDERSERVLWPLGLFYWGAVWTLAAWCELRADYRSFRLDRFESLVALPDPIPSSDISLKVFLQRCAGPDCG